MHGIFVVDMLCNDVSCVWMCVRMTRCPNHYWELKGTITTWTPELVLGEEALARRMKCKGAGAGVATSTTTKKKLRIRDSAQKPSAPS